MTNSVLKTVDLCKSFGALQAAKRINIDLREGEIHALIGPNGAGKSTLIQQIAGALKPDSGQIWLNSEEVTSLNTVARAQRGLARTFQISALAMEDTVLQNVLLGALGASGGAYRILGNALRQKEQRLRAEDALERVGILELSSLRASELSHGQRRQLEIAISLTLSPKMFVMDEPMAGLGTEGSTNLTRLLDSLREQAPILLVEHDMDAVFALADRVSVLVYGEILMTGTVSEIRNDNAVRQAYLGVDA